MQKVFKLISYVILKKAADKRYVYSYDMCIVA